jgi:hypothetical protein
MESKVLRSMKLLGAIMLSSMGLFALPAPFNAPLANTSLGSNSSSGAASCIAENGADESLQFDNLIHVDGSLVIGAYAGGTMSVDIGLASAGATVFRTDLSAETAFTGDSSSIVFFAEGDATAPGRLDVYINSDCYFTSGMYSTDNSSLANAKATYASGNSYDQTVTFSGSGEIIIHLVDGSTIAFDSLFKVTGGSIDAGSAQFELNDGTVNGTLGTNVYTIMDQSEVDINSNYKKLTFVRNEFNSVNNNLDVTVRIGCDSTFTFLSTDDSGLVFDSNAHVCFDVSNYGVGRMNLEIAGGNQNQFHDGAFLMYGVHLDAGDYENPFDPLYNTYKTYFAGNKAIVSVSDDMARNDADYTENLALNATNQYPYYTGNMDDLSARGLRVINHCKSTNPYAANPFADFDFRNGGAPFSNRNQQVGCVLGINGTLKVGHNTFFDYIAASPAIPYDPNAMGLSTLWGFSGTVNIFKPRSPAAFIIDGLDISGNVISGNYQNNSYYPGPEFSKSLPIILMQGQSAFHVRCCADDGGSFQPDYSLGNGQYDGTVINYGPLSGYQDGHMALDIEGETICFHDIDPDYDPDEWGVGRLNVPPLMIDYAGREVYANGDLVARPLVNGESYDIYQRSFIGLNDDLHLVNMVLEHNSMLHDVGPNPLVAQPAIVGGEKAYWDGNYEQIPFIHLSYSDVECHESLASSGVRWLVHDSFGLRSNFGFSAPEYTTNVSTIVCYNQGVYNDEYVRHYARVFMLGSSLNETYGFGTNDFMDSAFLSVYRDSDQIDENYEDPAPARCVLDVAPQTEYRWSQNIVFNPTDQAAQVFVMGNDSAVEIGWRDIVGYKRFDSLFNVQNAYPWNTNGGDSFSNDLENNQPAELKIVGNGYYFMGLDRNGNPSPSMVSQAGLPGVISVGYGGLLSISREDPAPHAFFDALVAMVAQTPTLYGEVDFANDQVSFGSNYSTFLHSVDLGLTDPNYLDLLAFVGGKEFSTNTAKISWSNVFQGPSYQKVKTAADVTLEAKRSVKGFATRAVTPVTSPVTLPLAMVQVGQGAYLDQLQVAGATQTNPFHCYFTGVNNDTAQVREFVSIPTTPIPVFGEGMYAALFLDNGAQIGLGSRKWNDKSATSAWNQLGQNKVTLYPNADCVVELNDDIIISDLNALIPTTNFGDVPAGQKHRITFTSQEAREIRVPKGGELDLSAFGQSTLLNGGDGINSQQICLAGKVRLVFEPGSTLRFPDGISTDRAPILYVTEEAQIIIDSIEGVDQTNFFAVADLDVNRVKFQGIGKIWLNKSAVLSVFDEAHLGIEADGVRTQLTWIQMSLQREAQVLIGDGNSKGGSFQVGNPVDTGAPVIFSLRINGADALFNIDRYGFFGLGAGILAQPEDRVNSWRLMSLFNVEFTEMLMIDGTFSHNQIYDGEGEGSLMAIGMAQEHDLVLATPVGVRQPVIRGGGNLINVNEEATEASPLDLAFEPIEDIAIELQDDALFDNGLYSLLASTPMIRQKQSIPFFLEAGISTIVSFPGEPELNGARSCAASARGFFQYLSALTTRDQSPRPFACFGINNGQQRVGFLTGPANGATNPVANIVRTVSPALLNGVDLERGAQYGFLYGTNPNAAGDSTAFRAPRQQPGGNVTAA